MDLLDGRLWSCGPQFASVMAVILSLTMGNYIYDCSVELDLDESVIPFDFVPLIA